MHNFSSSQKKSGKDEGGASSPSSPASPPSSGKRVSFASTVVVPAASGISICLLLVCLSVLRIEFAPRSSWTLDISSVSEDSVDTLTFYRAFPANASGTGTAQVRCTFLNNVLYMLCSSFKS